MKKISLAAYENSILNCTVGTRIEMRRVGDEKQSREVEVVVIPRWDFNTDEVTETVYELDRGEPEQPKFRVGEVLRGPTGDEFTIVDPLAAMMSLRKGAERKP